MTADSKSTPDRPLVEGEETSLELDVTQQVGIDANVEFPGLNPVSSDLTGSMNPVNDAQVSSDAVSPMPAKKKKRKTVISQPENPTYVRVLASDPRFASPATAKKKKKVRFGSSLQEPENCPDGMNEDAILPQDEITSGDPTGPTDMEVDKTTEPAELTGGNTQSVAVTPPQQETPHLSTVQKDLLRNLSKAGTLDAYLKRPISGYKKSTTLPLFGAQSSQTTPVPSLSGDLMPPPNTVKDSPVIVLEGSSSPNLVNTSKYVPTGQSLAQLAQGQKAGTSNAGERIAEQFSPPGWPKEEDLHLFTDVESLFAVWNESNRDTSVIKELTVSAHKVDARVPRSKARSWRTLYLNWVGAVAKAKLLDLKDVTDMESLDKFWSQKLCPDLVMEALMEYRPGSDDNLPQWPRVTRRGLMDIFPNLIEPSSTEVQDRVRCLMQSNSRYKELLQMAWNEFQQFRASVSLPDVPPNCAIPELRLETDLWVPGSTWITPARKSSAHNKKHKPVSFAAQQAESGEIPGIHGPAHGSDPSLDNNYQVPVAAPAQSRSQGRGEGPGRGLVRGDPGRGGRNSYAAAPGPRSNVQMVMEAALAVGEQPNAANLAWAEKADQQNQLNHQHHQSQQGISPQNVQHQADVNIVPPVSGVPPVTQTATAAGAPPVPPVPPVNPVSTSPPVSRNVPRASNLPAMTDLEREDLEQRMQDPDYDPEYDGGVRTRTVDTLANNTMEASQFLAEANRINPACPLPVNKSRFAVSDYLGWGVPKMSDFAYKAFEKAHTRYVPNGPTTWEDWTFSIRESCRNLDLSHDQAWRLANRLLPDDLKRTVEDASIEAGFTGFCWNSWKILVGQDTNHINPITEAKKEIGTLKFLEGETVPQFLQRFNRIVQKGTAESTGLEDSMTPYAVLTQLHAIMQNPGRHGPGWLIGTWKNKYGTVHEALVTKNNLGVSESGLKYTKEECESHIRAATTELIGFVKSMYNTKVNTTNDIEVLYSGGTPSNNTRTDQQTTAGGGNARYTRRDRQPVTGSALTTFTTRGSNPAGTRCRGGQRRWATGLPLGQASLPPPPVINAQVNVAGPAQAHTQTRLPRSERPAILGPVQPEWALFPKRPSGLRMSPQAQAAAEFNLVSFDLAAKRFGDKICAACSAPHGSCAKIRDCTGIPDRIKNAVSERAQYLWGVLHNASLERLANQ